MYRRWFRYAGILVAGAAVWFGVAHSNLGHSSEDSGWVSSLTANVAHSTEGSVTEHQAGAESTGNANSASGIGQKSMTKAPYVSATPKQQTTPPSSSGLKATTQSESTGTSTHLKPGTSTGKVTNTSSSTSVTGGEKSAPVPASQPDLGSFTIIVSEDKGQTLLSTKTLKIVKGESLMQYMHENYQIETTDGDDFMLAINGIKSQWTGVPADERQPVDWFLYINNIQAPVGAADIYPHPGDVDTWDYHRWDPSTGK